MFDARISVPFGLIIAGPPLSGKSSFIMNLIDNSDRLLNKQFDYIIWFYGEYNKTVELLENSYQDRVKTVHGLPENIDDYIYQERGLGCHIYDDLMTVASSSNTVYHKVLAAINVQNIKNKVLCYVQSSYTWDSRESYYEFITKLDVRHTINDYINYAITYKNYMRYG